VLTYLSRYTHRVAISNRRLIAADEAGVTFKYKDYRIKRPGRYKTMTLATHEFICRFLMHVLPTGFHRIRHHGLFANTSRVDNIMRARELLASAAPRAKTPLALSPTNAPVAAAARALSRFSSAAHSRTTEHQHRAALSGSIPHDNHH
jgi:Putative transposase